MVTIERVEDGDPKDPDVSYWAYDGEKSIGYLSYWRPGVGCDMPSLYFLALLPIPEQIRVLQELQRLLEE